MQPETSPQPVERVEDFTPEWMTAALGHVGSAVEIDALTSTPIGTGQMADSFRFNLAAAHGDATTAVPNFPERTPDVRPYTPRESAHAHINVAGFVQVPTHTLRMYVAVYFVGPF